MIKGYEEGDEIDGDIDEKALKESFDAIEEDFAMSMNIKDQDVIMHGQYAIATNEFNKYNTILLLIELTIRSSEMRQCNKLPESEELNLNAIKDLLKDFKIQKSDDIYKQKDFVKNKIEKINNHISKLEGQLKKIDKESEKSEFDIEEQFVSVCLGLEIPVDDSKISLYQYGFMVKSLLKRVEELNKINSHVR